MYLGVSSTLYTTYQGVRRVLERVPLFERTIRYTVELKNCLLDSSTRGRAAFEKLYASGKDPFGFDRKLERFRFERALHMIEEGSNGTHFNRALEVGCSEGMFTRLMAGSCDSVVALDFSEIALERAKLRCQGMPNVSFDTWDARLDPINGSYDLIVATGVLEYIYRPSALKKTCDKIVRALRPGGYLLLGNTVAEANIEGTWIGRKLIRGTLINDYMARDVRLEAVSRSLEHCVRPFEHILLRRRSE